MSILDDIARYRSNPSQGGLPLIMVEKLGAKPVALSNVDVDPMTFRDDFYYNTRRNILYKKIDAPAVGCPSNVNKVWKPISSW